MCQNSEAIEMKYNHRVNLKQNVSCDRAHKFSTHHVFVYMIMTLVGQCLGQQLYRGAKSHNLKISSSSTNMIIFYFLYFLLLATSKHLWLKHM